MLLVNSFNAPFTFLFPINKANFLDNSPTLASVLMYVNLIKLSCSQRKARQSFHCSINQFFSSVLSDGLLLKMLCLAFEEKG